MVPTTALLSALAVVASSSGLAAAKTISPHVPLAMWSHHKTLNSRYAYVDAVFDEVATVDVLSAVLSRDVRKDNYHVLSSTAGAETKAEALCVFVHKNLLTSQLAEFGPDSFVQSAVKNAASSVVVSHTTRSQSLTQALASVAIPPVPIDKLAAWIKSSKGKKLLSNGETDLIVVTIADKDLKQADAKMKLAAKALLEASKDSGVDFALTGDAAQQITVKDPARRLAAGQAVTAESIICDAGYLIGLSSTGKAYCFSHYVHMTPEILTALIFGFFFLFLAYVGLTALHAIQTPLRYPLHGPPKGKEF